MKKLEDDPSESGEWPAVPQGVGLSAVEKAMLFGILIGFVGAMLFMLVLDRCK